MPELPVLLVTHYARDSCQRGELGSMESSCVGAYRGERRESAVECGAPLARGVSALGNVDHECSIECITESRRRRADSHLGLEPPMTE